MRWLMRQKPDKQALIGSTAVASLHRFNGGIPLGARNTGTVQPIQELPLPEIIVLPLLDYYRQALRPLVEVGQPVLAGQAVAPGVLASTSGTITGIEPHAVIHPSGLQARCAVIVPDGEDKRFVHTANNDSQDNSLSIEQLATYGVTGLGGAGFNTADKMRSQTTASLPLLIINGAECEPPIACDQALLNEAADEVVQGAQLLANLTHCEQCIIAVEENNAPALSALQQAFDQLPDARLSIVAIPPIYPTGAEHPLIRVLTGKTLPTGSKPADMGVLCLNVATAQAVFRANLGQYCLSRVTTIAGRQAAHPTNVRIRFGTLLSHVLKVTGNQSSTPTQRVRAGGPLSGFDLPEVDVPVTATTNCIMLESARATVTPQPCIRCGACADVCPVDLLPQQLYWYARADDTPGTERFGLSACIECGCCDLVCPSSIALTDTFRYAKSHAAELRMQEQSANHAMQRYVKREQRLAERQAMRAIELEKRKAAIAAKSSDEQIGAALQRARHRRKTKRS